MLVGAALVLFPLVGPHIDLSKIPSWLVYVYHSDGFYFVTSPLLLLLSLVAFLVFLLQR